ncbi:RNA ligase RtcB family protein [uncultured Aquitalea sp.]|uniref:RNA ligase RtcB family protein n=1 Tax=uncultured Aquitalea sp. TaxID=540272 RepID=UPI0025F1CDAE|nr:RNA ligase RtcB family protein [uncultured Aquitalea sp.]
MGNSIQHLADGVHLIASAKTWIEGKAIQQLHHTASLPGMRRVAGMPDLHPGRGYPVGAAFFSIGRLYPALIGNDIGCGMALWQTSLPRTKYSASKLEKNLGNIDGPLESHWQERIASLGLPYSGYETALGTIGGGNHFAELQTLDAIYVPAMLESAGLDKSKLLLLVHSGSRGFGQAILQRHVETHNHQGLEEGSSACADYLAQHEAALRYAHANRQLIARRMLERLRAEGDCLLDIDHNLLSCETINGETGWLHRKGATPATQGLVVIPGSRGDYSYLVKPLPSANSLFTLAHGAGRKWMRSECKERLASRYKLQQLSRTVLGSHVICDDRELIYEEAPEAYKNIETVIDSLQSAGLIEPVARLKPVLTYKTRRESNSCC